MLVVSRRVEDTIMLPEVGISLEILSVRGNRVKVGIQAPSNIRVLRGELNPDEVRKLETHRLTQDLTREQLHDLKNRLNAIGLGLRLFQRQQMAGMQDAADVTLNRLFDQFDVLGDRLEGEDAHAGLKALLVEDDGNERELLAGLLRMSGYDVVTSRDGLEALEYLEEYTPDVVLLDMRMPRCDGPTTIRHIRKNPSTADLYVIAVSAAEPDEFDVPTGSGGFNRWFSKPLNPEALSRHMRQVAQTAASA